MFRNLLKTNNCYLFNRVFVEIQDLNYNTRACYPSLINVDSRYVYKNSTVIPICNNVPQMDVRYKTTLIKTDQRSEKKVGINSNEVKPKAVEAPTLTRAEKLKKAVKEYGSTVIVFHVGISLMSLGTCYLLVSSGLDVTKVFAVLGLEDWLSKSQVAASAGTFAVAYAVHKVFAPVRITITLASVPLIVRYLRNIGFLKK